MVGLWIENKRAKTRCKNILNRSKERLLIHINMRLIICFILSFVTILCSCNSDKNKKQLNDLRETSFDPNSNEPNIQTDSIDVKVEFKANTNSIQAFNVDDYPINNEMLKGNHGLKKSGVINSFDKVWFTNQDKNEVLVFELYTDYHRLITYHFDNNNVPEIIVKRMELHVEGGELATLVQKTKHFKGLIEQSIEINKNKFISEKGIFLGMSKKRGIEMYGIPDTQEIESGFKTLKWEFIGDASNEITNHVKPIAMESFGHSVTMIFRNDSLVGYILYNDIP